MHSEENTINELLDKSIELSQQARVMDELGESLKALVSCHK